MSSIYCFNFQSSQDSFLVKNIKFEKCRVFEKDEWRINANSVASQKMMKFLSVRRWGKRKRTDFYRVMLLMYAIWEYWKFLTLEIFCEYLVILFLDIVQKSLRISSHFDIVQIFPCLKFLGHLFQNIFKTI